MGHLLGSIFGLRPGERTSALLMASYHVLLLVTLYLLKPVRDSLFLTDRGPAELPFVFILTTVAIIPVAVLHTRAGDRLDLGPLLDGGSIVLILSLVGLRGLLNVGGGWTSYVLYAWVSIYGLLVTSQFWLLANALFTSAQSKRVFTVLSGGAILGAIIGGEVTGLLVETLGVASENLIWVAAVLLFGATFLAHWIRRRSEMVGRTEEAPDDETASSGALSIIRSSSHIQFIVGIIALTVTVGTLVDYQFKTVAAQAYPSSDALTTFMGQFYGRVSIVALLVQFVLAPRMMRIVGIGGALSLLPGILVLGSLGMLVVPGLVAAIFLRGAGQSLKHSIDKTGRELLFVPVSLEKKKRIKVFVDLFVDQGAQGLAGGLLLLIATGLGVGVRMLSLIVLALIGVWGVLVYKARQSYVGQFRNRLREQEEQHEPSDEAADAETDLDELLDALCSHAESDALQALDKLEKGHGPVPVDALLCLLDHPSATVREHVIRVFRVRAVAEVADEVAEALLDSDPDVQLEAARYLYVHDADDRLERLHQSLEHEDARIQAAAVGLIAEEGSPEEYELIDDDLLYRLLRVGGEEGTEIRTHVARLLGRLDRPYRNDLLRQLLTDESEQVVRAALAAAGESGERELLPTLVRRLDEAAYEDAARQALSSFDYPLLGTLYDVLVDEHPSLSVRRELPSIFAERPSQTAFTLLVRSLPVVPIPVRHAVIQALSKLHAAGTFTADTDRLDEALDRAIEHYSALGQILRLALEEADNSPPTAPSVLRTAREEALERIFRLLGLRYDQRDIYNAYLGLTSTTPSLRDSAVEFVDNLVDYDTRRYLIPLLNDPDAQQASEIGATFFDLEIDDWKEARSYLREVDDPRLSATTTDSSLQPSLTE